MEENQQCAHQGCSCRVTGDQKYCSEACRTAEEQGTHGPCECDHDSCGLS